jgi:hypothetical protein
MAKITNITAGPKGLHDKDGALVMLEPGQTEDIELGAGELNKEWFGTGAHAAKEAEKAADAPKA